MAEIRVRRVFRHLSAATTNTEKSSVAVVVGVGNRSGLGGAVAVRLADEGFFVVAVGRNPKNLKEISDLIVKNGGNCEIVRMESIAASGAFEPATIDRMLMEKEVISAFDLACSIGKIEVVVQNQGPNMFPPTGPDMREMETSFVQYMWDVNMLISFLVSREAARRMIPEDTDSDDIAPCGTILFTGATASVRGKPPFAAFAQAKAGVRMLAQSMAREFGPKGLHVVHLMIDGMVNGNRINSMFDADELKTVSVDAFANEVVHLLSQHQSAWTHETELRPYAESW